MTKIYWFALVGLTKLKFCKINIENNHKIIGHEVMNILSRWSIKYKILLIPIVGIFGFVINIGYSYKVVSDSGNRLAEVRNVYYPILENSNAAIVLIKNIGQTLNVAVSSSEQEMLEAAEKDAKTVRSLLLKIEGLEPKRSEIVKKIMGTFESYYRVAFEISKGMIDGTTDFSTMGDSVSKMTSNLNILNDTLNKFRDESYDLFLGNIDNTASESEAAIGYAVLGALLVGGILIFTSLSIALMITKSLNRVVFSLENIASGEGDLTKRIQQDSSDEIGDLVSSFNSFIGKLQGVIKEVLDSIEPLSDSAGELSSLASSSQNSTKIQLDSTLNVSRSIHEMFQSLNENAANASNAADEASSADTQSREGLQLVRVTVQSINELAAEVKSAADTIMQLEKDTESVGSILDVIQSIAGQTNLLALNAAIEAARAGEHGRGFAVVADEVRTLASRTQESTEEINGVIEQLQKTAKNISSIMDQGRAKAESSVELAENAGNSLIEITDGVGTISQMNMHIAAATEQQQQTSKYIQEAVDDIRGTAEKATKDSTLITKSTQQLHKVTDKLNLVVSNFVV